MAEVNSDQQAALVDKQAQPRCTDMRVELSLTSNKGEIVRHSNWSQAMAILLAIAFCIGTSPLSHAEERQEKAAQIVRSYTSVNARLRSSAEHYTTMCGGQRLDVDRVLQGLNQRCPEHERPDVEKYRDSRAIARWYHERGELALIENALERVDLIKPGAVLFFGRNDSVYKNLTAEQLFVPRSGIDHLGVVVKIHKNASGKVTSYELFHGHRRPGQTAASTTNWHLRDQTRPGHPPFGNGRQQLIAAARLLNPAKTLALLQSK